MPSTSTLLQTDALHIRVGDRHLIADLNWRVERGECWCVLGRNGSGKSTLLYALAGLSAPSSGKIFIDGIELRDHGLLHLAQRRSLMLQQQADAFAHSAFEQVLSGRAPYQSGAGWDAPADLKIATQALAAVGMQDFSRTDVMRLSGGERQRVALATLLAQAPALMLLDEPFAHQDIAQQSRLIELLRRCARDHAVIATCHDINLAARLATHVLILGRQRHWLGSVAEMLTVDTLRLAYGCEFVLIEAAGRRWFVAE